MKHILVPTDGSARAASGIRYAAQVARHYAATVHGLHVVDVKLLEGPFLRDVSASLGTAPFVNYQGNIAMLLEERGKAALEFLRKVCAEHEVPCETEIATGLVARTIVERARLTDLIILGRGGEHEEWLDGLVGSTTQAVVRRATQPVLITSNDAPGRERFVIAYDGSSHAKKALQTAARVGAEWNAAISVLAVGTGERTDAHLAEARAYLDAHDLRVDYVAREGDPSETIVRFAQETATDLLIMGAYGHSKVRELVVGSTTVFAMNHATCPLLLTR